MEVYWWEQAEADLPAHDDWLSAGEAATLAGMHFAKRRADWRLGRWTAKQALAAYLHLPDDPHALAGIEIRPAPSGAPETFLANKRSRSCDHLAQSPLRYRGLRRGGS